MSAGFFPLSRHNGEGTKPAHLGGRRRGGGGGERVLFPGPGVDVAGETKGALTRLRLSSENTGEVRAA